MSDKNFGKTFGEAFKIARRYPSSGARSDNSGVPSRPTLARYASAETLGSDPFGSPIASETKAVLAVLVKLAEGAEETPLEIAASAEDKTALRDRAERAVLERYDSAEGVGFALTGSVNHSAAAITAVCAVSHGTDPLEAVRNALEGETKRLAEGAED